MTVKTKAIVLLYAPSYDILPHHPSVLDIKRSILRCCAKTKVSVLNVITATDAYDIQAIKQYITAAQDQGEAISLIVNAPFPTSLSYVPLWCMIGTLSIIGLIEDVQIYERWDLMSNIRKEERGSLKKINYDFLGESISRFQEAVKYINGR